MIHLLIAGLKFFIAFMSGAVLGMWLRGFTLSTVDIDIERIPEKRENDIDGQFQAGLDIQERRCTDEMLRRQQRVYGKNNTDKMMDNSNSPYPNHPMME